MKVGILKLENKLGIKSTKRLILPIPLQEDSTTIFTAESDGKGYYNESDDFDGISNELQGFSGLELAIRDHSNLFPTSTDNRNHLKIDEKELLQSNQSKNENLGLGINLDLKGSRRISRANGATNDIFQDNSSMDPFASFELKTPTSDSFTFHASPLFTSSNGTSISSVGSKALAIDDNNRLNKTFEISSTPPRIGIRKNSDGFLDYRDRDNLKFSSPSTPPPRQRQSPYPVFSPTNSDYSSSSNSPSMNRSS